MNPNTLLLHTLPAILHETLEVPVNIAAAYATYKGDEVYDLLNKFPIQQPGSIAIIEVMDLQPLYQGILNYLHNYIVNEVPINEPTKAELYFEIKETVALGLYIRPYLYGTGDSALEEDVTNLLLDLHGYITDEELDWLLQDLFPDYHGKNEPTSLNPFYNLGS